MSFMKPFYVFWTNVSEPSNREAEEGKQHKETELYVFIYGSFIPGNVSQYFIHSLYTNVRKKSMDFFEFTNMNSDFQWRCVVIFLAGGQKCSSPKMFGIKEQWNIHTTALYPWYLSTQSSPKRLHMSTKTKCCWLPGAQQRRCSAEKVICLICCFKLSLKQNLPLQEPEEASRLEKSPRNLTRRRHVVWADAESSGLWWSQNKLPESWPCFNISFRNDLSDNTRAEW